jgi:hypothetical protein
MWGQALSNLGQQIGGAIERKRKKKEEKDKNEAAINVLSSRFGMAEDDARAAVDAGLTDSILSMNMQASKMEQQQSQFERQQALREAALKQEGELGQQRVDISGRQATVAETAEARQAEQGQQRIDIAKGELELRENIAAAKQAGTSLEAQTEAAELAKTKAETAKIEAQTGQIGQPKDITPREHVQLLATEVDGVSFADYLQELKVTKKIKGGELHQKGLLNFDENQIAAFDNLLRRYPEYLEDMPDAVKKYYGYTGSARTAGGGTLAGVSITPQS